ncbi:hypothetical protein R1flu_020529 [Riccia fluitans]|uniref:Uncharacterized protein n=1 Tax=Riccia fluitans TaxID=41844 RepID=A0ABD1ZNW6_9MARC
MDPTSKKRMRRSVRGQSRRHTDSARSRTNTAGRAAERHHESDRQRRPSIDQCGGGNTAEQTTKTTDTSEAGLRKQCPLDRLADW